MQRKLEINRQINSLAVNFQIHNTLENTFIYSIFESFTTLRLPSFLFKKMPYQRRCQKYNALKVSERTCVVKQSFSII